MIRHEGRDKKKEKKSLCHREKTSDVPFRRVDGVRVYEIPVLDALAAVKNSTPVMAQRTLEQVHT